MYIFCKTWCKRSTQKKALNHVKKTKPNLYYCIRYEWILHLKAFCTLGCHSHAREVI